MTDDRNDLMSITVQVNGSSNFVVVLQRTTMDDNKNISHNFSQLVDS